MVCTCQRRAHPSDHADELPLLKVIQIQSDVSCVQTMLEVVKMLQLDWEDCPERDGRTDRQTDRQRVCLAADVVWLENVEVSI